MTATVRNQLMSNMSQLLSMTGVASNIPDYNQTDRGIPVIDSAFPRWDNSSEDLPAFNETDYAEDYPILMDTSNFPYPGVIQSRPLWEVIVKCVAYGVIMLLALIGNILVVFIVWQNKRMRTTTNYFIVNLAVSDLMVTSSCTWVHLVDNLTENWVLGAFFCKFNSFAQG